jgi:SAM-dependent methyltransferase
LLDFFRRWVSPTLIWPSIEQELLFAKEAGFLNGLVLNAGAGTRDISHLIEGTLVNQDIRWDNDTRSHIHIYGSLNEIPKPDNTFDTIVCIAVLEHVDNPHKVISEFYRVIKPQGYVVASVPFLQPEHKVPTDFRRYTRDGLKLLFEEAGFTEIRTITLFNVFYTLHWILEEILVDQQTATSKILRYMLLAPVAFLARNSNRINPKIASAFQIIVQKPNKESRQQGHVK